MIEIELTFALAFYSAILCLFAGALWLYTEFYVHRPQRMLGQQFLWRCIYCAYTYLDESAEHLSKCPRCNSLNAAQGHETRPAEAVAATPRASKGQPEREAPTRNTSRRKRHHQQRRGPRRRR